MTETTGIPMEPVEEVKEEPKKKAPKKKAAPSDQTVIRNLRKDLRELDAKLADTEQQLAAADSKAELYFNKYKKVQADLNNAQAKVNEATHYMGQTIMSAIQSFTMTVK